jgi:oligopeptidase B
MKKNTTKPVASRKLVKMTKHGNTRRDYYAWLRASGKPEDNPEIIGYLKEENDYTDALMAHTKRFQKKLFLEMKGRIKETDMSVPYKKDGYWNYSRTEEGLQYTIYCRKQGTMENKEEVLLDVNKLAKGHKYCSAHCSVSFEKDILAYAVDTVGRRIYTVYFKSLTTGKMFKDTISDISGNMTWANDNKTLFYSRQDSETLRSHQIWRHELGTDSLEDVLVYEEKDKTFSTYVFKTKSKRYIMIVSSQTLSDEYRYVEADDPAGEFRMFCPREIDHEYAIEHFGDRFYILTNYKAKNFRLMSTSVSDTKRKSWKEVISHRKNVLLENFEIFNDFLVLEERNNGLVQIRITPNIGGGEHYITFNDPAYSAGLLTNSEFDTEVLRFGYNSMTTPGTVYDYNMRTREKILLKQQEVLGDFDQKNYKSERIFAKAEDGTKIPISLVYKKDTVLDGNSPLLLYGYGSYGHSMDAGFGSSRISLLDRGFLFAIAHIRGGEDMGRYWYEDGKKLKKKNTFTDFIACAEHLINKKYTNSEKLFAMGGSAGGLLMGAVLNMRSDLFHGVVAQVPFVDIVTTMLDTSIPLTTGEYDEWGNPNEKEYYDYILSYSPYDNVEAKEYPHLMVTTGIHDSQVQYFEPAKWVAKLRYLKKDDNLLLMRINMGAGHGGASGRFDSLKELAEVYTFILDLANKI